MDNRKIMSHVTSINEIRPEIEPSKVTPLSTALEVVLIYAAIIGYIWHGQHTYPHIWLAIWAAILVSHFFHRDTLGGMGFGWTDVQASAWSVLPVTILFCLLILIYGFKHHSLELLRPTWQSLVPLVGYGGWCVFQQYLTQSYFHNRLMSIIPNRHLTSFLIAILFSSTHIPNTILMIATAIAGFIFAEVFSRHRSIWPLALAQTVGGLLLAAVAPDALIHHMRVGPGYFFYGIR
jgi:hypothetical protein